MATSTDGWRRSRVRGDGAFLVVADLHNHTLMSDGRGDPEQAFAQMRAAGLDVAALTDHASIPREQRDELGLHQYPDAAAMDVARHMPRSIDDAAWERTAELADEFDAPADGEGTDVDSKDLNARMVALEAFNRGDDYLFGLGGAGSAIVACLDAGWRPGLIGCSDEHGSQYGLVGRGRTGLWVHEHSRSGVRDALAGRRSFATREVGLRLDATLDGVPMGAAGPVGERAELAVDLGFADAGQDGADVELQVL